MNIQYDYAHETYTLRYYTWQRELVLKTSLWRNKMEPRNVSQIKEGHPPSST